MIIAAVVRWVMLISVFFSLAIMSIFIITNLSDIVVVVVYVAKIVILSYIL